MRGKGYKAGKIYTSKTEQLIMIKHHNRILQSA